MLPQFTKVMSRIAWISLYLAAAGLVTMTIIIGWQVWGRYILNNTPHWSERLSLVLMNWYILLAAAVGVREKFHLGLVLIRESFGARVKWFAELITHLLIGGFGVAMVIYGSKIAISTWTHVIPTLGVPTSLSYLPFPVAGALIVVFSLEHIAELFSQNSGQAERTGTDQ